jgi:hypothetical protein
MCSVRSSRKANEKLETLFMGNLMEINQPIQRGLRSPVTINSPEMIMIAVPARVIVWNAGLLGSRLTGNKFLSAHPRVEDSNAVVCGDESDRS